MANVSRGATVGHVQRVKGSDHCFSLLHWSHSVTWEEDFVSVQLASLRANACTFNCTFTFNCTIKNEWNESCWCDEGAHQTVTSIKKSDKEPNLQRRAKPNDVAFATTTEIRFFNQDGPIRADLNDLQGGVVVSKAISWDSVAVESQAQAKLRVIDPPGLASKEKNCRTQDVRTKRKDPSKSSREEPPA